MQLNLLMVRGNGGLIWDLGFGIWDFTANGDGERRKPSLRDMSKPRQGRQNRRVLSFAPMGLGVL